MAVAENFSDKRFIRPFVLLCHAKELFELRIIIDRTLAKDYIRLDSVAQSKVVARKHQRPNVVCVTRVCMCLLAAYGTGVIVLRLEKIIERFQLLLRHWG